MRDLQTIRQDELNAIESCIKLEGFQEVEVLIIQDDKHLSPRLKVLKHRYIEQKALVNPTTSHKGVF